MAERWINGRTLSQKWHQKGARATGVMLMTMKEKLQGERRGVGRRVEGGELGVEGVG